MARLHLAQGQAPAALALLDDWQTDARAHGRLRSEIEALALRALAHSAAGDSARAETALQQALALAQPKGFRRVFVDEGAPLVALLERVVSKLDSRALAAYAARLLRDMTPQPPGRRLSPGPLTEPLSTQERRVLRLLAAGLSNPEIARELVVSTNTIKTQVQSIYRKLNVTSREAAGEAARELNLL